MLVETAAAVPAAAAVAVESAPTPAQMAELARLMERAERPLLLAGGTRWTADAVAALRRFAERFALPVAVSFRRQMLFDHAHPCYAGDVGLGINPKLAARVREADLLLLLGGRFSEVPSQSYELLAIPEPAAALVHVHPGPEIGRAHV